MIITEFNDVTKTELLRADSVAEYIERAITQDGVNGSMFGLMEQTVSGTNSHTSAQKWYGANSIEKCLRMIDEGDPATADKISDLAQAIDIPPLTSLKRKLKRGDTGDTIDMQAVYTGNLANAWTRTSRATAVSRRQICIVLPMQGVSNEPSVTFFWRSVAGLAMADKLSEAGFSVKIEGDYSADVDGNEFKKFIHRITLKDYNQPLDIAGLAGVICLAGFKRIYGFCNFYKSLALVTKATHAKPWCSINSVKLAPEELTGFEAAATETAAIETVKKMAQLLEFKLDGNSRLEDMDAWARGRL